MKGQLFAGSLVSVLLMLLLGACVHKKSEFAQKPEQPVRVVYVAYFGKRNIKEEAKEKNVIPQEYKFVSKKNFYKDGTMKYSYLQGVEYRDPFNFQDMDYFIKNIENFFHSCPAQITREELIANEKYWATYKNIYVLGLGGVEISPEIGDLYFKNKWKKENPKYKFMDHIVSTGNNRLCIVEPRKERIAQHPIFEDSWCTQIPRFSSIINGKIESVEGISPKAIEFLKERYGDEY